MKHEAWFRLLTADEKWKILSDNFTKFSGLVTGAVHKYNINDHPDTNVKFDLAKYMKN
tara:strand:+ start:1410 stop:1583 length:174 start_codon:yes stop_codon:yes gene_type:complete